MRSEEEIRQMADQLDGLVDALTAAGIPPMALLQLDGATVFLRWALGDIEMHLADLTDERGF